jgi:hypothetical protein
MSVTLDWTSVPLVRCGKKWKLSSDGGVSGSKKFKLYYGGVWRSLRLTVVGSLESDCWFCVGAFDGSRESGVRLLVLCWCVWQVTVKMVSHSINFTKKCYKSCTFNAICKDNSATNCITDQHKKNHSRQILRVTLRYCQSERRIDSTLKPLCHAECCPKNIALTKHVPTVGAF